MLTCKHSPLLQRSSSQGLRCVHTSTRALARTDTALHIPTSSTPIGRKRWAGLRQHQCVPLRPASETARQPTQRLAAAPAQQNEQGLSPAAAEQQRTCFWGSGMSKALGLNNALEEACLQALSRAAVPSAVEPELAIVFISSAYAAQYEEVVPLLRQQLPSIKHVVGCTGYGVIGMRGGQEAEEVDTVPVVSVALARLPGVDISLSHVSMAGLPDGDAPPSQWASLLGLEKQFEQQQLHQLQQTQQRQEQERVQQQQQQQEQQNPASASSASSSAQQEGEKGQEQQDSASSSEQQEEGEQDEHAQPSFSTSFILFADPSFLKIQELLQGLDFAFPAAPKIGGMASAGSINSSRAQWCWSKEPPTGETASTPAQPSPSSSEGQTSTSEGETRGEGSASSSGSSSSGSGSSMFGGSNSTSRESKGLYQTGVSVLALSGPVSMDLIVAQGCRPLSPYTWHIEQVTPDTNCILALRREGPEEGKLAPAPVEPLEALRDEIRGAVLSEVELHALLTNLSVGLAPDTLIGDTRQLAPHDFLIRPLALDSSGVIAVGDYVRVGQRLRFMVRDKFSAENDLIGHGTALKKRQLQCVLEGKSLDTPIANLIFSCVGRGSNLHNKDSFDAKTVASYVPVPTAGFLGNGEIGKVGSTTHLHGFTCAVGVLRAGKGLPLPPVAQMPAEKS